MKNQDVKVLKAKNIGEVSWLKMHKVPVVNEVQFERKRTFFFLDNNNAATNLLKKYYASDFYKFYQTIQDTRGYLFDKLNENHGINL